jgi:hypothetical protein
LPPLLLLLLLFLLLIIIIIIRCDPYWMLKHPVVNLRFTGSPYLKLDAFGELRKPTISFVCVSVCLNVRMDQLFCRWQIFKKFDILKFFRQSVGKIKV